MGRLTDAQVAQFRRDGYTLFHQPVFPDHDFARLKALFEENLATYGPDNLDTIHFRDPRLLEFLLADPVVDLVEPLLGPDIGLWSSHFISKEPHAGKATPWHEDSAYWNGRVSTMENIVTVWLAIDPATPENGAMAVLPGTHTHGFSDYRPVADRDANLFPTEIVDVDESRAVTFTLAPNQCSLHEARIVHGARANTSPHRRAGYTMRYFPTTSLVHPERNPGHRLWLVRGRDHAGNRFENA